MLVNRCLLAIVVIVSCVVAGVTYATYLAQPESLWFGTLYDRHRHYDFALNLGMDLRNGDFSHFIREWHRSQVWGVTHGVLLAVLQAVAGPDLRLAVVPSLAGWVLCATFGFLAARRLAGNVAGCVTALFILVSPAHQSFAADCMLESLGAGLTLACIYTYLATVQDQTRRAAIGFALSMTLLFLTKYNYWLLVALGLGFGEAVRRWSELRQVCWRYRFHPLDAVIAVGVVLFLVGFRLDHGMVVSGPSRMWPMPSATVYATFLLLLLRIGLAYRAGGRAWLARQEPLVRQLILWHGVPIALWFVWPKRLAHCVWYLTKEHGGEVTTFSGNVAFYKLAWLEDYHIAALSAVLAIVLALVAIVRVRKLPTGAGAVILCFAVIVAVNLKHPSKRSRFLHSWIGVTWVLAGAGFATAFAGRGRWKPWAAGVGVIGLTVLHGPGFVDAGHSPEGGSRPSEPQLLTALRTVQPCLADEQNLTLTSNIPCRFLLDWTFREYSGSRKPVETTLRGLPFDAMTLDRFEQWLQSAPPTTIVHVELLPDSPLAETEPTYPYVELASLLHGQSTYRLERTWRFEQSGCEVTMWKKAPATTAPGK